MPEQRHTPQRTKRPSHGSGLRRPRFALCAVALALPGSGCGDREVPSGVTKTLPPLTTETIPAALQKETLYVLHERYGLETFRITGARCNLRQSLGAWEFTLGLKTSGALQRVPGTRSGDGREPAPSLEVSTLLPPYRLELKTGRIFSQKEHYDSGRNVSLTEFVYVDSNALRDVVIELLDVTPSEIEAKITGTTGVKHGGSDTKVALVARFRRDASYGRTLQ